MLCQQKTSSYLASQNMIVSTNFRKENKRLKSNEKQTKHTGSVKHHFSRKCKFRNLGYTPDVLHV